MENDLNATIDWFKNTILKRAPGLSEAEMSAMRKRALESLITDPGLKEVCGFYQDQADDLARDVLTLLELLEQT